MKRLADWAKGSRHMNFVIPMVWREPQDHSSDCYFFITQIEEISSKSKHTVKYPNLPSAVRAVSHSEDLPIPHPSTHPTLEDTRISALEKRYQGQSSAKKITDYSWTMTRDVPDAKHRRKSTNLTF